MVEAVGVVRAEVGINAANGKIHLGKAPGGRVRLLPVYGDVAQAAAVGDGELLGLHEHAAGTATGVIHTPLVRLDHLNQELDDALRGVELATELALRRSEAPKEILVHPAQDILGARFRVAEADGADEVNQFAEPGLVERRPGVVLGEDTLEYGVLAFDGDHGVIHQLADVRLLGVGFERRPTCLLRHPEDISGGVLVAVFADIIDAKIELGGVFAGLGRRRLFLEQLRMLFRESVRDVLQKDQTEHDMLVLAGVNVATELVGSKPKLGLKSKIRGIVGTGIGFGHRTAGHSAVIPSASKSNNGYMRSIARQHAYSRVPREECVAVGVRAQVASTVLSDRVTRFF